MPIKLTHTLFLERLHFKNRFYRNGYFEVINEYYNSTTSILLKDKYGLVYTRLNHLMNNGCTSIKGAVDKTNYFINKSKDIHGDKFDYTKSVYKGKNSKIEIICKHHNLLFKVLPNNHLHKKNPAGCPLCGVYSSSESKRITLQDFLYKAKLVHNNFYNYDKSIYIDSKSKITITCPFHGEFSQKASNHLAGKGCKECGKITSAKKIKFRYENYLRNHSSWIDLAKKSKNFTGYKIYILKIYDEYETFYKVGKTFVDIKNRVKTIPYNIEILDFIENNDGRIISNLETEIFRLFKSKRYKPLKQFNGNTECFYEGDSILKFIREHEFYSNKEKSLL